MKTKSKINISLLLFTSFLIGCSPLILASCHQSLKTFDDFSLNDDIQGTFTRGYDTKPHHHISTSLGEEEHIDGLSVKYSLVNVTDTLKPKLILEQIADSSYAYLTLKQGLMVGDYHYALSVTVHCKGYKNKQKNFPLTIDITTGDFNDFTITPNQPTINFDYYKTQWQPTINVNPIPDSETWELVDVDNNFNGKLSIDQTTGQITLLPGLSVTTNALKYKIQVKVSKQGYNDKIKTSDEINLAIGKGDFNFTIESDLVVSVEEGYDAKNGALWATPLPPSSTVSFSISNDQTNGHISITDGTSNDDARIVLTAGLGIGKYTYSINCLATNSNYNDKTITQAFVLTVGKNPLSGLNIINPWGQEKRIYIYTGNTYQTTISYNFSPTPIPAYEGNAQYKLSIPPDSRYLFHYLSINGNTLTLSPGMVDVNVSIVTVFDYTVEVTLTGDDLYSSIKKSWNGQIILLPVPKSGDIVNNNMTSNRWGTQNAISSDSNSDPYKAFDGYLGRQSDRKGAWSGIFNPGADGSHPIPPTNPWVGIEFTNNQQYRLTQYTIYTTDHMHLHWYMPYEWLIQGRKPNTNDWITIDDCIHDFTEDSSFLKNHLSYKVTLPNNKISNGSFSAFRMKIIKDNDKDDTNNRMDVVNEIYLQGFLEP